MTTPERRPWICTWTHDNEALALLVHADTIEEARLEARRHAGPTLAVGARLATRAEAKRDGVRDMSQDRSQDRSQT